MSRRQQRLKEANRKVKKVIKAEPEWKFGSAGEPVYIGKGSGRNKPCPCRSGKKFKDCCIVKTVNPARKLIKETRQAAAKCMEKPTPETQEEYIKAMTICAKNALPLADLLEPLL